MISTKQISLNAPSLLHLGCVWAGQVCELGIALQHPQIQLVAQASPELAVSGACGDIAWDEATRLIAKYQRPLSVSIEIETAIPTHMGLGSEAMMRASLRRVYGHWHTVTSSFRMSLAEHAAQHGGLILADDEGLLQRRAELPRDCVDDQEDWVFVFVLPDASDESDDLVKDIEAERRAHLRQAVRPGGGWSDGAALFAAAEQRDFAAFTGALAAIQTTNEQAVGIPRTPEAHTALALLHDNGAAMCGPMLTGLGLFGLVKGGPASRTLRAALQQHYGYGGPLILASVCDGTGIRTGGV